MSAPNPDKLGEQTPSPILSVIIINWNSKEYVHQCLTSLYRHTRKNNIEVVVVDNASFDGCGEMIAEEFPSVQFIQSHSNLGFSKANNLGATRTAGQYILFLNPDTIFIEDTITELLNSASTSEQFGLMGCKLLNGDLTLQTSCVQALPTITNQSIDSEYLRRKFPLLDVWGVAALFSPSDRIYNVEAVSGACILISRKTFELVQGFTNSFFMYAEDMDLCLKIHRENLRVYYNPKTSIIHLGGGSSRKAPSSFSTVMTHQSISHYFRINHGPVKAIAYRFASLLCAVVRMLAIPLLLVFGSTIVRHKLSSFTKWYSVMLWALNLPLSKPLNRSSVKR